jgi:Kae1-associated kinase Bud32
MRELSRGAEAVLYKKNNTIIKDRIKKSYRIKELDEELRKQRTKKEAKLLSKLPVKAPKLISSDKQKITMEYIKGKQVKEILNKKITLAKQIGQILTKLHNQNIIHGDLTTSNMIYNKNIYLIDFGLSYHSTRVEDKAVDIHLFKRALDSKHSKIANKAFKEFLKGYKPKHKREILKRLEIVELRGRNKTK